jgi:hypothetical protein
MPLVPEKNHEYSHTVHVLEPGFEPAYLRIRGGSVKPLDHDLVTQICLSDGSHYAAKRNVVQISVQSSVNPRISKFLNSILLTEFEKLQSLDVADSSSQYDS